MDFRISWVLSDTPLFRIMPLKWFKVMVKEKRNYLVRPSIWDDPHEMIYSRSVLARNDKNCPLDATHWFGQCWSICEESPIIWHTFKKSREPYVKIKVSAKNLINDLKDQNEELRIAILEYIRYFKPTITDYEEKIKEVMMMHQWPRNFIQRGVQLEELYPMYALLTKRDIFSHEEEARLLLFDKSVSIKETMAYYTFDPTKIEEVIIDPWTSVNEDEFQSIKNKLRKELPDENIRIDKSKLFGDSAKFSIRYTT